MVTILKARCLGTEILIVEGGRSAMKAQDLAAGVVKIEEVTEAVDLMWMIRVIRTDSLMT